MESNEKLQAIIAGAKARVETWHGERNIERLWATLSNPANQHSRRAFRALAPDAPAPTATITAWKEHLDHWSSGELNTMLEANEKQDKINAKQREQEEKAQADLQLATSGCSWKVNGIFYSNSLDMIRAIIGMGYIPEKRGFGTVAMVQPSGTYLGPWRKKEVNAALRCVERAGVL